MTEHNETGANHIVGAAHLVLTDLVTSEPLPAKLFVQIDKCTLENKNRYVFPYMECLIAWNVFTKWKLGSSLWAIRTRI